jgi:hypothetical protein
MATAELTIYNKTTGKTATLSIPQTTENLLFQFPGTTGELVTKSTVDAMGQAIQDDVDSVLQGMRGELNTALGTITASSNPKPIITHIIDSGHNAIAMLIDGKLFTTSGNTGKYSNATVGRGVSGNNLFYGFDNLKRVHIPSLSPIKKIGGFYHTYAYALLENGELYMWGNNNFGQCGFGHTAAIGIPTLCATGVDEVYDHPSNGGSWVEYNRLFIKRTDGYIYGCGYNGQGQLGIGSIASANVWTKINSLGLGVVKLFNLGTAYGVTFALKSDNTIWATGYNANGQIGDGTVTRVTAFKDVTTAWAGSTPIIDIKVSGGYGWVDVNVSGNPPGCTHMMLTATVGNNFVRASGHNAYGSLGDGTTTSRTTPVAVLNSNNVIDIAVSGGGPAVLRMLNSAGELYACGYNNRGNGEGGFIGDGTRVNRSTPVMVLSDVSKLLTDGATAHLYPYLMSPYVVKTDGSLWTTGYNATLDLGIGVITSVITSYRKVLLPIDEKVVLFGRYTTDNCHGPSCVYTDKGNLYAWGHNDQQGLTGSYSNVSIDTLVPVQFEIPKIY